MQHGNTLVNLLDAAGIIGGTALVCFLLWKVIVTLVERRRTDIRFYWCGCAYVRERIGANMTSDRIIQECERHRATRT